MLVAVCVLVVVANGGAEHLVHEFVDSGASHAAPNGLHHVLTPRIGFTVNWLVGAQIFLQYAHYDYGERVRLRPGQVALETLPDTDVVKLQAQVAF